MTNKVFRTTTLFLGVMMIISAFATSNALADDAGWSDRILALNAAINPWLISAMVVWSAGEIIGAIHGQDSKPKA
jgi:hypothetical protein